MERRIPGEKVRKIDWKENVKKLIRVSVKLGTDLEINESNKAQHMMKTMNRGNLQKSSRKTDLHGCLHQNKNTHPSKKSLRAESERGEPQVSCSSTQKPR